MTPSVIPSSATRVLRGFSICVGEKASFSLISTVAVLCESPTTTIFISALPLFVSVESGHQQVHPKEGEQHYKEADDSQYGGFLAAPAGCQPAVQKSGIDEPGDERPGLFRVPAPVSPPCSLRPDRTRDYGNGKQWKAECQTAVVDLIKRIERREPLEKPTELLLLEEPFLHEVDDRSTESHGKARVTEKCHDRMDDKPFALECRVERCKCGRKER